MIRNQYCRLTPWFCT